KRVAAGLIRMSGSVRPKVAVYLPNCLEYYLVYWALVRLGGIIVPLNSWLSAENLASIFARVEPDLLICQAERDRHVLDVAPAGLPVCTLAAGGFEALSATEEALPANPLAPEDVSIVMHTSGTTSAPKGGM